MAAPPAGSPLQRNVFCPPLPPEPPPKTNIPPVHGRQSPPLDLALHFTAGWHTAVPTAGKGGVVGGSG